MKVKCNLSGGTLFLLDGKYRITSYKNPVKDVPTELTLSKIELTDPQVQLALQRGWISEITAAPPELVVVTAPAECPHGFALDAVCDYCNGDKDASSVEGATVIDTLPTPPEPEKRGRRRKSVDPT